MAETFDLEQLVHLEQTFYDAGYEDGFAHGCIHGLIEGRALGREKGFEIWEEIGFYEGFALTWQSIYEQRGDGDQRAVHHIRHLLDLIGQFPTVNPSALSGGEVDISKLQRQIRSRYKALCASLGVRPTLRASGADDAGVEEEITTPQNPKRTVWALEGDTKRQTPQGLSF
ncbi:hypothetical protein PAXINDRAFT_102938 [Paxillus involutus ATCC 200175]|uniref:Unplaced genomic scaffold PAXINscaffold_552, whole genome shotgun sequence n=1 Tax=Paxillus involutus ATCC 200175 TaxID=664439 RepID=A0A0C9SN86_PAXIN|nr:hypothetical protein PAXINDRAFT_102938 [Paxillus involutus ATCC 200175]